MTFLIIDATAGYRLMWKGKDTRYTVFLDKRRECKPDILCDDRQLPLRDHIADVIICDPPHRIREPPGKHDPPRYHWINQHYSLFRTRTSYISYLYHTNTEFHRTIKENGRIHLKLTEGTDHQGRCTHTKDLHYWTNFQEVSRIQHKSRDPYHQANHILWLTLKPHN
jgi:tRNA G10  N-methylase Trm11